MQCAQCQAEIPENQSVCPACGWKITKPQTSIPADPAPAKPMNAFGNLFVALVVLVLVLQFLGLIISILGIVSGAYLNSLPSIMLVSLGPILIISYFATLYHKKWGVYLLGITVLLMALATYWESKFTVQNSVGLLIPGIIVVMALIRWKEFK